MSEVHYRGGPLGMPYPRGQAKRPGRIGQDRAASSLGPVNGVEVYDTDGRLLPILSLGHLNRGDDDGVLVVYVRPFRFRKRGLRRGH